MHSNVKRRLAVGVIAAAAAAFAGGAYAAARSSSSDPRQAFLNDASKRLHVTPQQLSSALQQAAIDRLNAAVASGRLTKAQADALKQRIQHGGLPLPLGPGLAGARFFHGHNAPWPPGPPGVLGGEALSSAASYLGLTETQLWQQLRSGKSLGQVAKSRGKSTSGLKAAVLASIKARLNKAVAAKILTSAQEQKALSGISGRLDDLINRSIPRFGGKGPGSPGPWRTRPNQSLPFPRGGAFVPPGTGPRAVAPAAVPPPPGSTSG